MKNKKCMIKILILTICILCAIYPNNAYAALQANKGGTSLTNVTADAFFTESRKMEQTGGTLGTDAKIDSTTYRDSSGNGIDSHMALNTEWGGAALLADSIFGVGNSISGSSDKTTTGNSSGVYNMANGKYEYVAGIWNKTKNNFNSKIIGADSIYYNNYTAQTPKVGDAFECAGWLSASRSNWAYSSNPVFLRGYDALFGFYYYNGYGFSSNGSRAVVVCGAGL